MADYIDKGALLAQLAERLSYLRKTYSNYDHYTHGYSDAFDVADDFITADVVEVVRCKDCEYGREEDHNTYSCANFPDGIGGYISGECFCSYGERKEQE